MSTKETLSPITTCPMSPTSSQRGGLVGSFPSSPPDHLSALFSSYIFVENQDLLSSDTLSSSVLVENILEKNASFTGSQHSSFRSQDISDQISSFEDEESIDESVSETADSSTSNDTTNTSINTIATNESNVLEELFQENACKSAFAEAKKSLVQSDEAPTTLQDIIQKALPCHTREDLILTRSSSRTSMSSLPESTEDVKYDYAFMQEPKGDEAEESPSKPLPASPKKQDKTLFEKCIDWIYSFFQKTKSTASQVLSVTRQQCQTWQLVPCWNWKMKLVVGALGCFVLQKLALELYEKWWVFLFFFFYKNFFFIKKILGHLTFYFIWNVMLQL
jgi:hypothetical protein